MFQLILIILVKIISSVNNIQKIYKRMFTSVTEKDESKFDLVNVEPAYFML